MGISKPCSTPDRIRSNCSVGFKNFNKYSNTSSFKRVVKLIFFTGDLLVCFELNWRVECTISNKLQSTKITIYFSRAETTSFHHK